MVGYPFMLEILFQVAFGILLTISFTLIFLIFLLILLVVFHFGVSSLSINVFVSPLLSSYKHSWKTSFFPMASTTVWMLISLNSKFPDFLDLTSYETSPVVGILVA